MNLKERAKVVRAMETICRSINDEEKFMPWLSIGVADGDITKNTTDEDLEYYCEDDNFADLMWWFIFIMKDLSPDGGLFVDGVISKREDY